MCKCLQPELFKCKAPVKSPHVTNIQVFYTLDAVAAAQPTVSKQSWKNGSGKSKYTKHDCKGHSK